MAFSTSGNERMKQDATSLDIINDAVIFKQEDGKVINPAKQRFLCAECGKGYKHSENLAKHYLSHLDQSTYACLDIACTQKFLTIAGCISHQSMLHKGLGRFFCPIRSCREPFSSRDEIIKHRREAHPQVHVSGGPSTFMDTHRKRCRGQALGEKPFVKTEEISPLESTPQTGQVAIEDESEARRPLSYIEITEDDKVILVFKEDTENSNAQAGTNTLGDERMAVGFVIRDSTPLEDVNVGIEVFEDYPELLALDDEERTQQQDDRRQNHTEPSAFDPRIMESILEILNKNDVALDEFMDLWASFLDDRLRINIRRQLGQININQPPEATAAQVGQSVVARFIRAWSGFKEQAKAMPARYQTSRYSAPSFIRNILEYCQEMEYVLSSIMTPEDWIELQTPSWESMGAPLSKLIPPRYVKILLTLRRPPAYQAYSAETPFPQLFYGLEQRVRCRTYHPEGTHLTHSMILHETGQYVSELRQLLMSLITTVGGEQQRYVIGRF